MPYSSIANVAIVRKKKQNKHKKKFDVTAKRAHHDVKALLAFRGKNIPQKRPNTKLTYIHSLSRLFPVNAKRHFDS